MIHVLVGTAVGALLGGGASVLSDVVRRRPIDWKRAGASALGGAAAGAITSLTFGAGALAGTAATRAGGMVLAGASGGAVERTSDNLLHDRTWHEGVVREAGLGAALGGLGAGGRAAGTLWRSSGGRAALRQGGRLLRPASEGVRRAGQGLSRAWSAYLRALDKRPLLTKSATSGVITGSGDLLAQAIQGDGIDLRRTALMTAFGTLWVGPSGHLWYRALSRVIPGSGVLAVGGRVAADQLLMAPFGTALFFSTRGLVDGKGPREIAADLRRDFWPALKANYMLWPGVQAVNFGFVPPRLQVGFGNVVALGWTVWLSGRAGKNDRRPAVEDGLPGQPETPSARRQAADPSDAVAADAAPAPTDSPAPRGEGLIRQLERSGARP